MPPRPVRPLLLASWLTGLLAVAADLVLMPTLPDGLQAFIAAEVDRPPSFADGILIAFGLPCFALSVYGSVQLYRLRWSGRGPLALGTALGVAGSVFAPTVQTGPGAALTAISLLTWGALLGWLYLPPRISTSP